MGSYICKIRVIINMKLFKRKDKRKEINEMGDFLYSLQGTLEAVMKTLPRSDYDLEMHTLRNALGEIRERISVINKKRIMPECQKPWFSR